MKTNSKQGPDLDSIISGLNLQGNGSAKSNSGQYPPTSRNDDSDADHGRLWNEFMVILNDPEEDPDIGRNKLYAIDDDIVETLHQCDFRKPNVHVINSILRTFLIDNIARLKEMHRPRSKSLLDKYD